MSAAAVRSVVGPSSRRRSTPPDGAAAGRHGRLAPRPRDRPAPFGITAPTPTQSDQIIACSEHYHAHLPPDMKVELYSNRVRIEPGAFGARAELINAVGRYLAGAVPDDQNLVVAPQTRGADHAWEQLRRACAVAVPDGFVRVVQEATGFEDEGWIGTIYLVLKTAGTSTDRSKHRERR